jgi:two-component system, NarL family, invasion response regulator UvrY
MYFAPFPQSVLLFEPHEGLRYFLRAIVDQDPSLALAGEAANSDEAMKIAGTVPNPVVIADPWLPPCGVFHLISDSDPVRLVLYSDKVPSQAVLHWAFNQGASVVSGADPVAEIKTALKSACAGSPYYSISVRNTPVFADCGNGRFRSPVLGALADFTAKQLCILLLCAQGQRVREIAESMDVSYKSVDSQLYRIRKALGVTDRVELTHLCLREGLISVPGLNEKSKGLCTTCGDRSAVSTSQSLLHRFLESEVMPAANVVDHCA